MSIVQRLEQVSNDEDAKDLPNNAWAAKHLITFARGGHRHQVQIDMSIAALGLGALRSHEPRFQVSRRRLRAGAACGLLQPQR